MKDHALRDKDSEYYNLEKGRLAGLIPEGPNVVLDLGCATGRLGRKLREQKKAKELVGVEIFKPAAEEAAKYYDKVYQGDIEHLDMNFKNYFDFVVCGDILEHLRDPWKVLERIHDLLKTRGILIASIPNIRYWRVLRDLILFGKWQYREGGILDVTHLRFFTKNSFLQILNKKNFCVEYDEMIIGGRKQSLFNKYTCGLFEEFMGSQVLVMAKKGIKEY